MVDLGVEIVVGASLLRFVGDLGNSPTPRSLNNSAAVFNWLHYTSLCNPKPYGMMPKIMSNIYIFPRKNSNFPKKGLENHAPLRFSRTTSESE